MRAFVDHGLYEVEVVDESAPAHRADIGWVDSMPGLRAFSDFENGARRYWSGAPSVPNSDMFEVVTESPLRVVQRVLSDSETKLAAASAPQSAPSSDQGTTEPEGPREIPQIVLDAAQ